VIVTLHGIDPVEGSADQKQKKGSLHGSASRRAMPATDTMRNLLERGEKNPPRIVDAAAEAATETS
jgi:hypothetical protein